MGNETALASSDLPEMVARGIGWTALVVLAGLCAWLLLGDEATPDGPSRQSDEGGPPGDAAGPGRTGSDAGVTTTPFRPPPTSPAEEDAPSKATDPLTGLANPTLETEPTVIVARLKDPADILLARRQVSFELLASRRRDEVLAASERVTTDNEGIFTWTAPASLATARRLMMILRATPRGRATVVPGKRVPLPSPLPPGVVDLGTVWLQEPPVVSGGRVLDAEGVPVPGAVVRALRIGRSRGAETLHVVPTAETRTDLDGVYELRAVLARSRHVLHAERKGFAQPELPRARPATNLKLVRCGTLEGTVILPPGVEPSRVRVVLRGLAVPPRWAQPPVYKPRERARLPAEVNAEGRFRFPGLLPGPCALFARTEPDWFGPLGRRGLNIVEGRNALSPHGEFDLRPHLYDFVVTVVDGDGQAVSNARVSATNRTYNGALQSAVASGGRATLLGSPQATFDIVVEAPGFATHSQPGVRGDVTCVLDGGAEITARIKNGDRLPVGTEITLEIAIPLPPGHPSAGFLEEDHRRHIRVLVSDGVAVFDAPHRGTYEIKVLVRAGGGPWRALKGRTMRHRVIRAEPQQITVDLARMAGRRARGRR